MKIPGKSINYEYDFEPETGEAIAILSGLKWLRLPLPFLLGHINVWLLQDGDGWAIVDTGIFTNAWQLVATGVGPQYCVDINREMSALCCQIVLRV